MEEEYTVASEIKSETKVAGKLMVSVFYFLSFYWIFFYVFRVFVHPQLLVPYALFAIVTGIFLTMPSYFNKKRKNYESIFIYLRRDKYVYQAMLNVSAIKKRETLKLMMEREENERS